jgi:hypothetical protein
MEKAKQGWSFGLKSRKQQQKQEPTQEQKRGMTVREHMTQSCLVFALGWALVSAVASCF